MMLSSLRDKLLNVKKNVSIFSTNERETANVDQVNLNAGTEILSHFQQQWEILHTANEENANKANDVAVEIEKLSKKIIQDKENLSIMSFMLINSNLKQNISSCSQHIQNLYDSFQNIEKDLNELENTIEQIEHENIKKQHNHHLEQYKDRKNVALSNLEETLKDEYRKSVEDFESDRKKLMQERQQVFQEAFKQDLEVFKNLGTIPKLDLPKKSTSALLEEIQLDYDPNELDQFFEDLSSD